eukprot:472681-Pyramimonas_sp.AAC.1
MQRWTGGTTWRPNAHSSRTKTNQISSGSNRASTLGAKGCPEGSSSRARPQGLQSGAASAASGGSEAAAPAWA